ncbi:MAG: hypothetical protein O2967_15200 [Proteobacteria bacterium]|nr:hypothetical protein [Pseudomonadota bacterium]
MRGGCRHSLWGFDGCRDYARFDFRASADGGIKLLEANPNPGWCWDGKFDLMADFAGHDYPDLLRMILEAAQRRTQEKLGSRNQMERPVMALRA